MHPKNMINADTEISMQAALEAQRNSYLSEGMVSASTRIDRIYRAIDALVRHSETISNAMNEDFGCRPRQVNLMTDVSGSIGCPKHCRQHLKTFSHAQAIYRQTQKFNVAKLAGLLPPYGDTTEKSIRSQIMR